MLSRFISLLLAIVVCVLVAPLLGNQSGLILLPPFLTVALLYCVRQFYFIARQISHYLRKKHRQNNPIESDSESPATSKAVQDVTGELLHGGQWKFLPKAIHAQGEYFCRGIMAAILPPLALLLLALQVILQGTHWESFGVGLIIAESICLAYLIYVALTQHSPASEWVTNRLKAEILRREQYLLLAQIGPYASGLSIQDSDVARTRRAQIEASNKETLRQLILTRNASGMTWLEELCRNGVGQMAPPESEDRIAIYLQQRVTKQLNWFTNAMRQVEQSERRWSTFLKGALTFALVVALVHATDLYLARNSDPESGVFATVVTVLGFLAPPIGAAIVSIQNLYSHRLRWEFYNLQKSFLHSSQASLRNLLGRYHESSSTDAWFEFRCVAARTEESLSSEMHSWLLLMDRPEYELSP